MSTGTITEAKQGTGEDATVHLEGRGDFAKWFVTITTADSKTVKTSLLRKPSSPDPTGLPVEYDGKRWKIAAQGGQQGGKASGGSKYEADPKKLRAENRRSALHCAAGIAPDGTRSSDVLVVAQQFFNWIVADD